MYRTETVKLDGVSVFCFTFEYMNRNRIQGNGLSYVKSVKAKQPRHAIPAPKVVLYYACFKTALPFGVYLC